MQTRENDNERSCLVMPARGMRRGRCRVRNPESLPPANELAALSIKAKLNQYQRGESLRVDSSLRIASGA